MSLTSPTPLPESKPLEVPVSPFQMKRERLRFSAFRFVRTPSGVCTAEVELEWLDGVKVVDNAPPTSPGTVH